MTIVGQISEVCIAACFLDSRVKRVKRGYDYEGHVKAPARLQEEQISSFHGYDRRMGLPE